MATPSHLNTINSTTIIHPHGDLHFKPPSPSSSTLNSMKLKTLIQTFILSHLYRVARALAKAKSVILELLKDFQPIQMIEFPILMKKNKQRKKLFFGSFRLHYNWCSSHVVPVPMPIVDAYSSGNADNYTFYDSSWNSFISSETCHDEDEFGGDQSELSRYLQWLEEKSHEEFGGNGGAKSKNNVMNDIDRLADLFIANCHERFKLEKQESYRRFQEMMARSV